MTDLKRVARQIFQQTLASIDIPGTLLRKLQLFRTRLQFASTSIELQNIRRIHVIAIGKAAHPMVAGLCDLVGNTFPLTGVVSAPTPPATPAPGLQYFVGGHPVPNEHSWESAETILQSLQTCDESTFVVFLISGGGSSLVELPLDPALSLEDIRVLNRSLVTSGADIDSMNTVRKHFSAIKGGRLALAAPHSLQLTIAVTDVPVGKESALASGPSLPDPTTIADVERVFTQFSLREKLPAAARSWWDSGRVPETPKPSHPAFRNSHFLLLLGMDDLFHAAHIAAESHGFSAICDNSTDDLPVQQAAVNLLTQLDAWQRENPGQPVALIADGEVSSPVTGKGTGGRNSAFALSCVEKIAGKRIAVLSAGTDGVDGNSPAAGAVADGSTSARARQLNMSAADYFANSDAFSYFSQLDDAIVIGPTGNNLRDLRILLSLP